MGKISLFHSFRTIAISDMPTSHGTANLLAPPPHRLLMSLLQSTQEAVNHPSAFAAVHAAKERALKMDQSFQRAESELEFLHREVQRKASSLKALFSQQEASYEREVQAAWDGSSALRESLREVESRMNRISQVGTRIGDRLQVSSGFRSSSAH